MASSSLGAEGNGLNEPKDMVAAVGIETIHQDSVGRLCVCCEFEFGVIDDNISCVFDAQYTSHLQGDPHLVRATIFRAHRPSSYGRSAPGRAADRLSNLSSITN